MNKILTNTVAQSKIKAKIWEQFDWIIEMGCDLIGQKIDYLNTNIFKE